MVECAREPLRMDLLGRYQSAEEWWESSGPSAHALSRSAITDLRLFCSIDGKITCAGGNLSFCELCLSSASVHFILFRYFLPSVSVSVKSYGLCFSSRESCGKCQIYWADWTAGHAQDEAGASKHCCLSHRRWFMFQSRRTAWGMRARASVSCSVSLHTHDKLCESHYFIEQHRLAQ